jgi:hypothetical protein
MPVVKTPVAKKPDEQTMSAQIRLRQIALKDPRTEISLLQGNEFLAEQVSLRAFYVSRC